MRKFNGTKRAAAVCAAVMALSSVSAFSASAAADEYPDSEAVYSLCAQTAEQGVFLKWEAVENAEDYIIYRARCDEEGNIVTAFEKIAVARSAEYTDRSARGDKGIMYVYKIRPRFKENGAPVPGDYSDEVFAKAGIVIREISRWEDEDDDVACGAATEGGGDVIAGEGAEYDGDIIDYCEEEEIGYDDDEDFSYEPSEDSSDYNSGITAGRLTAGEWKDNEKYAEYLKLTNTHKWAAEQRNFGLRTDRRHKVTVTDANGGAVENALVTLKRGSRILGQARTDCNGTAYVYYNIYGRCITPARLEITAGSERRSVRISAKVPCDSFNISLKEEHKAADAKALDLMFMIDTTGSMDDELAYLQAEFLDVIKRVDSDNPNLDKRVSMNFYRDEGDDYVLRSFDFTADMKKASKQLSEQEADGGGNYPEAVHTALDNAVNGHKWREDSTKILFMVLDAPAHSSEEITRSLVSAAKTAAAEGIRIIPIVSSGAEFDVEYLMRTMAVISGGTYVYLTDESGVGYSHLAPTLPEETEDEKLNELMIRVIDEYLGSNKGE